MFQLQPKSKDERLKDLESAVKTAYFWQLLKFVTTGAGATNRDATKGVQRELRALGASTDLFYSRVKLSDLSGRPWMPGFASVRSLARYKSAPDSVLPFPVTTVLKNGAGIQADFSDSGQNPDGPGTKYLSVMCMEKAYAIDPELYQSQTATAREMIEQGTAQMPRYLPMSIPFTGSVNDNVDGETTAWDEPLLVDGVYSELVGAMVTMKRSDLRESWSDEPVPVWSFSSNPSFGIDGYFKFPVSIYLPARATFKGKFTNPLGENAGLLNFICRTP